MSNEGQHGGVEKKTPIDQSLTKADGGHRTANGVNPMSTPTSCFTNANPMPIKENPHRIRACNRWGHKTWQGFRNPAEGHRNYNTTRRWKIGEKKEIPMFWPTTENVEQLKKTLALLPEMLKDPAFPFGKKELFDVLALQITDIYEKYYPEAKEE